MRNPLVNGLFVKLNCFANRYKKSLERNYSKNAKWQKQFAWFAERRFSNKDYENITKKCCYFFQRNEIILYYHLIFFLQYAIFCSIDNSENNDKIDDADDLKDDKSANLLIRGLQLYLYENSLTDTTLNDTDYVRLKDEPLLHHELQIQTPSNKNEVAAIPKYKFADYLKINDNSSLRLSIDLGKELLPNETIYNIQDDDEDYADVDFTKSEYVNDSTLYRDINETLSQLELINNLNDGFLLPPIPDGNESLFPYEDSKTLDKRHEHKPFLIQTYFADEDSSYSNPINVDSQIDASERHELDVRFNSGNEEAAPSTQRQVIDQEDSASQRKFSHQSSAQAYYYTSIENRPSASYELPHPPLQTDYPKAIQNNYTPSARILYRPSPQQYGAQSIPSSLPSIVHEPSLTDSVPNVSPIRQAASVPLSAPLSATAAAQQVSQNVKYYPSPAITSTYSNQNRYSQQYNNYNEKVVVKIVPATGWYLNDAKERQSYYNAVSHGLLNENGYVFVNDVQRTGTQNSQINAPTPVPPSSYSHPVPQSQPSQLHSPQSWQFQRYGSPLQAQLPQPRQLSAQRQLDNEDKLYKGETSYNVPLNSVGKLVGDSKTVSYNLASLRSS